ncbi:MAG: NAD(P)/FAD-dependent oxidoreductase [Burkholderiaceae bacterium]|nr:NAD(P)/FAD-dependent oxidoreductase [Burkholderiaceae bacterium]
MPPSRAPPQESALRLARAVLPESASGFRRTASRCDDRALVRGYRRSCADYRSDESINSQVLSALAANLHDWRIVPSGTEGFRKAEVTAGGVATGQLDRRTMQALAVPGLHFIGEVVDVTGWLGGYNFQWAWASGFAAGQAIGAS